jgi:hypothetical protein
VAHQVLVTRISITDGPVPGKPDAGKITSFGRRLFGRDHSLFSNGFKADACLRWSEKLICANDQAGNLGNRMLEYDDENQLTAATGVAAAGATVALLMNAAPRILKVPTRPRLDGRHGAPSFA